jgi:hypothetical protein
MVFIHCALLSAAAGSLPPKVEAQARASITILRPHRANAESWNPSARRDQKVIVKKERDGTSVLLRLTEFE